MSYPWQLPPGYNPAPRAATVVRPHGHRTTSPLFVHWWEQVQKLSWMGTRVVEVQRPEPQANYGWLSPSEVAPDWIKPGNYWQRPFQTEVPHIIRNIAPVPSLTPAQSNVPQVQAPPRLGGRAVVPWPATLVQWPSVFNSGTSSG